MTTRLAGEATYFLPFNRGNHGGAGNPPNPQGRTHSQCHHGASAGGEIWRGRVA